MRVTRSMMMNNMAYWVSKQKELLNDISTVVASGKVINKPSDDPSATAEILEDRVTIAASEQYEENISSAETWVEVSNTTLDTVYSLLEEAEELFVSQASGDSDSSVDYVDELQQIYDQILSYANSMYGSDYLYSGNQSAVCPFSNTVDVSGGTAADIIFDLAGEASDLTIEITDSTGAVVRTITAEDATEGTNTVVWDGCDDDGKLLADGEYSFTVTATDDDGDAVAAYPTYRGGDGGKIVRTGQGSTVTLDNNGGEIFSQALKVLSQALAALQETDSDVDLDTDLGDALSEAIAQVQAEQVALANINSLLSYSSDRLSSLVEYLTERVSDLETGSTEEAAIELSAQETAYETTMSATSALLNMPKLSDYL